MLNFLSQSVWLLADDAAKPAVPAEDPGFLAQILTNPLTMFVMLGLVAYMMLMRPEQKRRKEMDQLIAGIKKNDKVILGSGICGTVVNAEPNSVYVTIRVDESTNTKLRVLRKAIATVGQPEEAEVAAKDAG